MARNRAEENRDWQFFARLAELTRLLPSPHFEHPGLSKLQRLLLRRWDCPSDTHPELFHFGRQDLARVCNAVLGVNFVTSSMVEKVRDRLELPTCKRERHSAHVKRNGQLIIVPEFDPD